MNAKDRKQTYEPVLGGEFHNPYTFIPFTNKAPDRDAPTPLTADERESEADRFTGILELKITTESPLLTSEADPYEGAKGSHQKFHALTIGDDVIVPATGVRGALRNLLTIITGGTLGYLDEDLWLCQGRDSFPEEQLALARVMRPGNRYSDGEVALGKTAFITVGTLNSLPGLNDNQPVRPMPGFDTFPEVYVDNPANPTCLSRTPREGWWLIKASGTPIGRNDNKREGAFLPNGERLSLPKRLWSDYNGRNRHGLRPELRPGDLVWLECTCVRDNLKSKEQVKSIQFARWGRTGVSLVSKVEQAFVEPDHLQQDGKVDRITDLFGQVQLSDDPIASDPEKQLVNFAARMRPENLVFTGIASKCERTTLSPLAPPHAGCIAFYRYNDNPGRISKDDPLRGYKVYRTTTERGDAAPWLYNNQAVYQSGNRQPATGNLNKTVDLVPEHITGTLRIALRSLSDTEMALLLLACGVPWRLGGGKPLGLGLCKIDIQQFLDEFGNEVDFRAKQAWHQFSPRDQDRAEIWRKTQEAVEHLRYPSALFSSERANNRGGHAWFSRFATPKKNQGGTVDPGLQPIRLDWDLAEQARDANVSLPLPGQTLPLFDPANPQDDVLYGHDQKFTLGAGGSQSPLIHAEPTNSAAPATGRRAEPNLSPNRQTRMDQRAGRSESAAAPVPTPARTPAPPPKPVLAERMTAEFVICEDPKGKGRLFAKHDPTGRIGNITNHADVPEDIRKIGEKLRLYVWLCNPTQLQLRWQPPATPQAVPKPKPK